MPDDERREQPRTFDTPTDDDDQETVLETL